MVKTKRLYDPVDELDGDRILALENRVAILLVTTSCPRRLSSSSKDLGD